MTPAIITALISGLCVAVPSLITTILSTWSSNKRTKEFKDVTLYRIDQLEKKQDKHNNLIDRMYKVESRVTVIEDEIKGVMRKWIIKKLN
mgnify:CR=1 FL=1